MRMAKDKASADQAAGQRIAIMQSFVVMRSSTLENELENWGKYSKKKKIDKKQRYDKRNNLTTNLSDQSIVMEFNYMADKWNFIVFDLRQIFTVNSRIHRKQMPNSKKGTQHRNS
jgi:hypothetical protein